MFMRGRMNNKTVKAVTEKELCTGCGTCVGLCPNRAIRVIKSKGIYIPQINDESCKYCGICLETCPGHSVDFKDLNLAIFGEEPQDILIGNYINCYVGYAIDYEIRYNSASGGLITALLVFALEEGIINGAIVTKMSDKNPLEPEVFIARTKEEILLASKSKYCPVPVNIKIREILKEEGRFAVVGLPCHIHGIRKAEMINKELKEKIALHLGLQCSIARDFLATEYLLQKFHIKKEEVTKLDYRGKGWIGGMTIRLRNSDEKFIPYTTYWSMLKSFFIPTRCTLCSDHSSELADISFGDMWLPEFRDDKIGTSVIISRSEIGEALLQNARLKKGIEIKNLNRNKVLEPQRYSLASKKNYLKARLFLFEIIGRKVPIYNQNLSKSSLIAYFHAILLYLQIYISSKRYLWKLLPLFTLFLKFAGYWYRKIERI